MISSILSWFFSAWILLRPDSNPLPLSLSIRLLIIRKTHSSFTALFSLLIFTVVWFGSTACVQLHFFFVCEIEHMRMKNSNHYRFSEYLNATIRHECIVQSSFYAFQCSVAVVAVRVVVVVAIFSRLFLCCIFDFDSNVYDSTSDLFFLHPCVFRTISFIVRIYVHIPNVSYNCTVRLWCCCCRCYIRVYCLRLLHH